MEKGLVSVIIPSYNHEKFIEETIKSIIAQTYLKVELIVVDDGSKDKTFEKICDMKACCMSRFWNLDIEKQKNSGTCNTLNKLISKSQGEFIYLIASDDVAKENALAVLVEEMEENDKVVLAVGDNEFIDVDSKKIKYGLEDQYESFMKYLLHERKDVNESNFGEYKTFLKTNYIPNGYLIRKTALEGIHFTPDAPLEDLFMHLQLSKIGKYKYVDKVLFSYRIHGSNTVNRKFNMIKMHFLTFMYEKKLLERMNGKREYVLALEETIQTIFINLFNELLKRRSKEGLNALRLVYKKIDKKNTRTMILYLIVNNPFLFIVFKLVRYIRFGNQNGK